MREPRQPARRTLHGKTKKTERVVTNVSKSTLRLLVKTAKAKTKATNRPVSVASVLERGAYLAIQEQDAADARELMQETVDKIFQDAGFKLQDRLGRWAQDLLARQAADKILEDAGLKAKSEQPAPAEPEREAQVRAPEPLE